MSTPLANSFRSAWEALERMEAVRVPRLGWPLHFSQCNGKPSMPPVAMLRDHGDSCQSSCKNTCGEKVTTHANTGACLPFDEAAFKDCYDTCASTCVPLTR